MSIELTNLRKLLQFFYANEKLERRLLLEDIRSEARRAKETADTETEEGGDFYGPFWSDVKRHAQGLSDITEATRNRILKNERRKRLYTALHDSFLFMWQDMMRWRNEPFEFVPKSVHARLLISELGATVKIENTVAVKIWDGSHRIIYPYFSEHPALPDEAARLGFWALKASLPDFEMDDFRIVDIQHRKYFRPREVTMDGTEKEKFVEKYAVLLARREELLKRRK